MTEPKPPKRSTTMASPVREIPSKIGWWTPYLDLQLDVGLSIGKKKGYHLWRFSGEGEEKRRIRHMSKNGAMVVAARASRVCLGGKW